MRLLNTETYKLEEFFESQIPEYAILSHRWGQDEVSLQDYKKGRNCQGPGYDKIIKACDFAKHHRREWLWVDTCCIDKKSSADLSEAINSMFRWYSDASVCFAYLSDVAAPQDGDQTAIEDDFRNSQWFQRGWTLQELVAPRHVIFCSGEWNIIGAKFDKLPYHVGTDVDIERSKPFGPSCWLNSRIHDITSLPLSVLRCPKKALECSVAARLSWAAHRSTTRIEDQAYSLLGIFNVNMPPLYGEGRKAFVRLQQEILGSGVDESIFAWRGLTSSSDKFSSQLSEKCVPLLAAMPYHFRESGQASRPGQRGNPRMLLESGLLMFRPDHATEVWKIDDFTYLIPLRCFDAGEEFLPVAEYRIVVKEMSCGHFEREIRPAPIDNTYLPRTWKKVEGKIFYLHASSSSC